MSEEITNEEYENFIKKIQEKDRNDVARCYDLMKDMRAEFKESFEPLKNFRDSLPTVNLGMYNASGMSGRNLIDNVYSQVTNLLASLDSLEYSFQSQSTDYTPPQAPGYAPLAQ